MIKTNKERNSRSWKTMPKKGNGKVTRIRFAGVKGRKPLDARRMRDFRKLVRHYQDDIVQKWVEYFVLNKRFKPQTISRRLA